MPTLRPTLIPSVLALAVSLAGTAAADTANKKTTVTFSAPVEIPGKVLPAGTYVFKVLDNSSNRNIVQIFNQEENQLYATILALPDYRQNTPDKTIIGFEERPEGSPMALKEWFYPGDNYGVEFVYPHDAAMRIAKRTHQGVLAMDDNMEKNITMPASSASDKSVREMQNAEVTGVDQSGNTIDKDAVAMPRRRQ